MFFLSGGEDADVSKKLDGVHGWLDNQVSPSHPLIYIITAYATSMFSLLMTATFRLPRSHRGRTYYHHRSQVHISRI
jgi:uncharacterized protein (UPF0261 family)